MSTALPHSLPFDTVAVLGPGLLGGSIAMAVRCALPHCELRLWARRRQPLELAQHMGITPHTYDDIQQAVRGAQLVILATPIGTFMQMAQAMLPALGEDALVTDVGSVKESVHLTVGQFLTSQGHYFIGSHPMAGAEKQGLEHARADLLSGATVALTNPHGVPQAHAARLADFWQALGCSCVSMTPAGHDATVARISHMPHILAALCARAAVQGNCAAEDLQRLASTGFRDTTRVSSGGPAMWADILRSNAPAIRTALHDCIADLQQIERLLEAQDEQAICSWLKQAKDARESVQR